MEEDKFKNEPVHLYCDSVTVIASEEVFLLAMRSGGILNAYMLTPAHTKRLLLALQDQVEKYETAFKVIEAKLEKKPMLSPFQATDLDGGKA